MKKDTIIIQIAGWSASGKTSKVAKSIVEDEDLKDDISLLSMDDYYRGANWMKEQLKQGKEYNFDQPEAVNMLQIQSHLMALKHGKSIQKPIYCMKSSEPMGTETVHPSRVVIMEWLFALSDELHTTADYKIFVQADRITRNVRRILRDTGRTNQEIASIKEYFNRHVEPMHQKYIQPSIKNANIILENNLSNDEIIEASRNSYIEWRLGRDACRTMRARTRQ